ncbi:rod shape-determining protein RodA [Halalkalibacterium ligniniphilum]|uniref:rod shape-determining protein RodA n=1 Tax=Halalkalibacterium ligniniphilum TaxID=1134413 RepID=UPI000344D273|nr:rod shape-determining protein RodA [Halalkalibacterium ligniniphilum]
MEQQKSPFQQLDYTLLFLLFLLMCISLLAIYSGTTEQYTDLETNRGIFMERQLLWFAIGIVLMIGAMLVDFEIFKNLSIPMYIIGMILLLWVEFFGIIRNGSQRWIGIGDAISFQPSEFVKIIVIIALAHLLSRLTAEKREKSLQADFILLLKILAVGLPPFFLILKQPDLGTALVIGSVIATMILVSGISWRLIGFIVLLVVAGLLTMVYLHNYHFAFFSNYLIESHQLERIYGWLNPEEYASDFSYQTVQAMIGIGSGQLYGSGYLQSIQSASGNVPELHTDFIFTVIGEEFGFIGATILLVIFFLMFYRMVLIALSCNNLFGTYLVAGVIGLLVFQVFQNIAMTVGLMPVTGLALPFISYGGTALLTNMIAIGIVLNVNMRTKHYMFKSDEAM